PTKVSGLLRSAIPISLTNGMSVMQGHFAVLALGVLAPAAEVGTFRIAASIFVLAGLAETALTQVSSPLSARLYSQARLSELRRLLRSSAWLLLLGTGGIAFVFIVSGPHLLELVFGMGYKGAWAPLAVLCVGGTVSCL